jgi:hypothetical protein
VLVVTASTCLPRSSSRYEQHNINSSHRFREVHMIPIRWLHKFINFSVTQIRQGPVLSIGEHLWEIVLHCKAFINGKI